MHILIVTDAWEPQINGVVRTLKQLREECHKLGHKIEVITPQDCPLTLPMPLYPEIRLGFFAKKIIRQYLDTHQPDAIHISTEGPLGLAARRICLQRNLNFTTGYHTRFPEYINARINTPLSWGYRFMRWFHAPSKKILVPTPTMRRELEDAGFNNLADWTRGVDTALFRPTDDRIISLDGPVFINIGRVSKEKNIDAFLKLDLPGTKIVIGEGPYLEELKKRYPDVIFPGAKQGKELIDYYNLGDVFVFPSLTDTFGLVMLEALACGLPVAAFPVTGPLDVVGGADIAILDHDLHKACIEALNIPADRCRDYALEFSWETCAHQFIDNLAPLTHSPANARPA
ncbi:MAG: alpha-mannosyltransferase [Kordiimonas sp.]|nr:alpha-mannosyltransferase [Kordiimonas sp.]